MSSNLPSGKIDVVVCHSGSHPSWGKTFRRADTSFTQFIVTEPQMVGKTSGQLRDSA